MEALEIGLIVAMGCILFLSLFGNFILLVVVHGQLPCQAVRNYSYLILNLAISDILLASSSIPFDIVQRLQAPIYPFGETMCKLLWPFQTVCSMASIFTVGALSYQRYRLVVRPLNGKLPRRRFFIMLASIWLLPVLLAGLPYSFVLRFDENTTNCIEEWIPATEQARMKLSFTTYLFIIQYVLPLGLIVWCNVKAILELKRYLKYRRRTSMICALSIDHHESTVKMLTVIMTVFALFWLPGQVMHFLLEFERENEFILNYGADIGYLFVFTNCVMNPLIFAYFTHCHKNFPTQFRKLTSSSSINPMVHAGRSNSLPNAQRRGSLPGNPKQIHLAKTLKRPSLPAILQCEGITDEQRKDLLAAGRNKDLLAAGRNKNFISTLRNGSILSQKKKLPVLTEISSTDSTPPPKQNLPMLCEIPDPISPTQDGDPQSRTQKCSFPGPGSHKRLSFSMQKQDSSQSTPNVFWPHTIQNDESQSKTEKRGSFPGRVSDKQLSFSMQKQNSSQSTPNGLLNAHTIQNGEPQLRTQKRTSFRLSFSIEKQDDPTLTTQNNDLVSNSQQDLQLKAVGISTETQNRPQTEKRSSFSILKKRDSHPGTPRDSFRGMQTERHSDVDAGNRLMKNFLEIMKTMKEDVLTKYLDATPETVLN